MSCANLDLRNTLLKVCTVEGEKIYFDSPVSGGVELPKNFFLPRIWFVNLRRLAKFAAEVLPFPVKNGRAEIN
jgi:hypothetical protein